MMPINPAKPSSLVFELADPPSSAQPDPSLFQALIENSQDLTTVVSADGRILYDSPAVERMLGYKQGELVGRNAFEFVHGDDMARALALLVKTAVQPGASASLTFRFLHREGRWCWLASSGRVLPTAEPRLVITSREVTAPAPGAERAPPHVDAGARSPDEVSLLLEVTQLEMLDRLALAAEVRDDDTGQHTRRVGELSAQLAQRVGLDPARVNQIRRAAPLHDVGKIGIPDAVLLKPGPLGSDELEIMRTHTVLGAKLLSGGRSELVRTAESIALHHHERWDGAGYPAGIERESIPLAARIVTIVDFYDALTHARPYRPAWAKKQVLKAVLEESGTKFDPHVTDEFLLLVSQPQHSDPSAVARST